MKNKEIVFKSRISGLLVVFLLVVFIPLAIKYFLLESYQSLFRLGIAFLFVILLFGGMRYIIREQKLYLKMWFIPNGSTDIKDIISVNRSYNLLSSPAGSLKRLSIKFKSDRMFWLISPVREKEFVKLLKSINSDINFNIPKDTGKRRILDWDILQ